MIAPTIFTRLADATSAAGVMHDYIAPVVATLCVFASLVCVVFLINGGYHYMSSSGKPENLEHAKKVIRTSLIGLLLVLGAGVLSAILSHAYGSPHAANAGQLPSLTAIPPDHPSNGLINILIKAITGLLNNIIQSVAQPFLKALSFFTTSTPLLAENSGVYNLWLTVVGITDSLFVLVVALLGFHVMSASTFGLDEIEFKHLLPRLGGIFLLMNSSIFVIDGFIELSNAMIHAINVVGGNNSVWDTLTAVVKQSGGAGVAALLIMIVFLIFTFILLVYYVGRLVTLYIGAVLSPLVTLLWLIPGFRDFSESAMKVYLTTVYVLFIHVIILQLAASLFAGMTTGNSAPDTLMAMVVGVATLIALLKTQGVMMQLSYVSVGPRTARKLGGQFMTGISYLGGKGRAVAAATTTTSKKNIGRSGGSSYVRTPKSSGGTTVIRTSSQQATKPRSKTGTTKIAPSLREAAIKSVNPGKEAVPFDPTNVNTKRRSKP